MSPQTPGLEPGLATSSSPKVLCPLLPLSLCPGCSSSSEGNSPEGSISTAPSGLRPTSLSPKYDPSPGVACLLQTLPANIGCPPILCLCFTMGKEMEKFTFWNPAWQTVMRHGVQAGPMNMLAETLPYLESTALPLLAFGNVGPASPHHPIFQEKP